MAIWSPGMISGRSSPPEMTLRVCQHRTCKSQGSHETLLMLKELAPRSFVVEACGCLGGCGHGPNIAAIPAAGTPLILPHVATPARVTKLLREVLQVDVHPDAAAALRWRIQGNNALQSGEYEEAVAHYNRAASIARDAGAACGLHLVLGNRAVARLALKDAQGALADAEAALDAAPRGWARGWLRKADALLELRRFAEAAQALERAGEEDPAVVGTEEYASLVARMAQEGVS